MFRISLKPRKQSALGGRIAALRREIETLPQYEPQSEHYFHAGMYVRKVFRHAGVCLVGKVHKKEHFYIVLSGTILVTDGIAEPQEFGPGAVIQSMPGTQRSVYAVTDATTMTVHRTHATCVEQAEAELVEHDPDSMFGPGNILKPGVIKHETNEVIQ